MYQDPDWEANKDTVMECNFRLIELNKYVLRQAKLQDSRIEEEKMKEEAVTKAFENLAISSDFIDSSMDESKRSMIFDRKSIDS